MEELQTKKSISTSAFPKIFHVGDRYIKDIFDKDVEITEKCDGSQVAWGKIDGSLYIRSHGKQLFDGNIDKLFTPFVESVKKMDLPDNVFFYGETLCKPHHNTLEYERVPKGNIALFGILDENGFVSDHETMAGYASLLGIDVVPLIFEGKINTEEELMKLLDRESWLGKSKIEGIVIKRYEPFMLGSQIIPIMMAKYVSEQFKEKHNKNWIADNTGKGRWEKYKEGFKTEARWNKAIQHIKENGELKGEPSDIGPLLKEINCDIIKEEKENIKDFLWNEFGKDLLRTACQGFPEFYKKNLVSSAFKKEE